MDLRQIQYFVRVFEERSFSKAAEKSHVVQPALSMQVRRLEEELGALLFERSSRGILPTSAGQKLYALCVPILNQVAQARQEVKELAQGRLVGGSIAIGLPPSVSRGITGKLLAAFAERYPGVDVTLIEGYSNALTTLVQDGLLDVALGGAPPPGSGLLGRPAYQDRLLLVAGQPILGPTLTPCRLETVGDLKLILPSRHNLLGATIAASIDRGEIRPARIMRIDGVVATLEMAQASDWAAVFPLVAMIQDLERPGLFLYPILSPAFTFDLSLVSDPRRPLTAAARAFVEMMETRLGEMASCREGLFCEKALKQDPPPADRT